MPRPYALQVLSRPFKVSEELWKQWYTEEHIRDLVYSGATRTSSVYRASSSTLTSSPNPGNSDEGDLTFLAIYQSDAKHPFEACNSPNLKCKVRVQSELFGNSTTCYDVGSFTPVDLQLVEILGSYEHREDVAPYVLHQKISGDEIENKIQFDHVNAIAILPGYRRTLLYRPIDPTKYGAPDVGPYVILLHEFDGAVDEEDLPPVKQDLEGIEPTRGCTFSLRAYSLLESEGFGGKCRIPERMER